MAESWLAEAVSAAQAQDWIRAESLLQPHCQALDPGALHLMGLILRAQGQLAAAADALELALQQGGVAEIHLELARLAFETQDLGACLEQYRAALAKGLALDDSDLHRYAHSLADRGAANASLEIYQQLLTRHPVHASLWMHSGNARLELGQTQAALADYARALALDDQTALIHYNQARAYYVLGDYPHAEAAVRICLALDQSLAAAWNLLGSLLQSRGELTAALASFEAGLAHSPNDSLILNNLGSCRQALYQGPEAEAAFNAALALDPDLWETRLNLAHLQRDRSQPELAHTLMQPLLAHRPLIRYHQAFILPVIPASNNELHSWQQRLEAALADLEADPVPFHVPLQEVPRLPFYLPYLGIQERPVLEQLARIFLKACPTLNWRAPHCRGGERPQSGRWRIALVSGCFFQHTVHHLFGYLIQGLDRRHFEVSAVYTGNQHDQVTRQVQAQADRFLALPADLHQARQIVAAQAFDLMLYLDVGMDPLTYFLAFSRLAPLQLMTWGHPLSSGLSTLDYFLSSRGLEPPQGQQNYTERLLELPEFFGHWQPSDQAPGSREAFGLPAGRLYLCPQSLYKFHPDFDAILAGILERDPGGTLVLIEGLYPEWRLRLEARWAGRLDPQRIHWLPRMSSGDYLRLLDCGQVMLDTRPFGGGLTMLQALSQGLPVVSWPGQNLKGRVTLGIFNQLDWFEGLADSAEDYVARAVALATDWDQAKREDLCGRYRERIRPELMAGQVGGALIELCEQRFV